MKLFSQLMKLLGYKPFLMGFLGFVTYLGSYLRLDLGKYGWVPLAFLFVWSVTGFVLFLRSGEKDQ